MKQQLEQIKLQALNALEEASTPAALEELRVAYLGKKGELTAVLKQMGVKFVSGATFTAHPLSEGFHRDLCSFVSTCRIVRRLRHARVGVIGARTTAFKSVRFDEGALEARGVDVETLDLTQVFDKIKAIADSLGFASDMKAYKNDPSAFKGSVADISMFLRLAVTGRLNSPDMYSVMQLLGAERVFARIDAFCASL